MNVLILVSSNCNRLTYIFNLMFNDRLNIGYKIVTSEQDFLNYNGPKLVYGTKPIDGELFFEAVSLLWELDIRKINPEYVVQDGISGLFPVSKGEFSFDVFASAFYLISRYEEYLPQILDEHGRFRARDSFAQQNGFLKEPLIEVYASKIKNIINSKYHGFELAVVKPRLEVTIDIDNLYAYKYKGLKRTIGA